MSSVRIILQIMQAAAALLPRLLGWLLAWLPAWLERRRVEKERAEAEARAAAVRADPAAAWLRKFNSQANPGGDSGHGSDQAGVAEPHRDA